jgi:hypothetical protein
LNEEGKGKTGKMKNLYGPIFDSPKGPEKKEDDPKKMNQDNDICKNLVEHLSRGGSIFPLSICGFNIYRFQKLGKRKLRGGSVLLPSSFTLFGASLLGTKGKLSLWPSGEAQSPQ